MTAGITIGNYLVLPVLWGTEELTGRVISNGVLRMIVGKAIGNYLVLPVFSFWEVSLICDSRCAMTYYNVHDRDQLFFH